MNLFNTLNFKQVMMIFHMTSVTENNQIRKTIIFPVIIYMMYIKFFFLFACSTTIRKLSQCKHTVTKFSINKIRVIFSNFARNSFSRIIVALNRTINIFNLIPRNQERLITKNAFLKSIWISGFIRTRDRAKLSFLSLVMNESTITRLTNRCNVMIKVITLSTAIKSVKTFLTCYYKRFFTKFAGFFHGIRIP